MPIRLRKLCAIVLIAAYSSTALAGLQDALEGMFMATATTPAAYSSQTRGGFVGGGVGVRMPVRNINLVTFDPPRFSAGCGGIDLYGGSFSFINADQLAALFRQIAANAAGALFKLAIDSINPQLGKIMEDFQNKIQQLNSLFKNTCQIANQVVQTFASPDARSTQANNSATLVESAKGAVTDIFDSIGKIFSSPNSQARASAADNPSGGNLVWKALAQTNAGQWLGNPAAVEGNLVRANEIIMSLTGTVVMPGGQADITDAGTGKVKPETGTVFASTLTLADLREGSTAGTRVLQILSCGGDADCMAPSSATIAFDGTVGHVNRVLFGDPTGANAGAQSDSLISNLKSCTTATCFTAAQRSFINAVSVPTLKLLRDVQHSPGAVEAVAIQLVPVIADELAIRLGEAAITATKQTFSGVKNVTRPPEMDKAIASLEQEVMGLRLALANQTDRVLAAKEYAKMVTASNPAIMVATPAR